MEDKVLEDILYVLMILLGIAATVYVIGMAILLKMEEDSNARENKETYI